MINKKKYPTNFFIFQFCLINFGTQRIIFMKNVILKCSKIGILKFKSFLLIVLLTSSTIALGQNYSRPSITPIFLNYNSGQTFSENANNISIPEKYDLNFFGKNYINLRIDINVPSKKLLDKLNSEYEAAKISKNVDLQNSLLPQISEAKKNVEIEKAIRKTKVLASLDENKIANKILEALLIDNTKAMSLSKLSKRAEYNASDSDVLVALNSEARLSAIRDNGLNLLNNLHIILFDTSNEYQQVLENGNKVTTYSGVAYLFKIDIETLFKTGEFDELVFTEPNSRKYEEFQNFKFPLKFIDEAPFGYGTGANVTQIFNQVEPIFASKYDAFTIKASVFETSPISSKIGKKESLKIDHLYRVSQTVQNSNGEVNEKTVGWLRVKKVADNRNIADGKTDPSLFYKVFSKDVDPGMKLTHKHEIGTTHGIGYAVGENNIMVGPYYSLEFNPFTTKGGRIGVSFGGFNEVKSKDILFTGINVLDNLPGLPDDIENFKGRNIYGEVSAQKIFQANILEFTPMIGAYLSGISLLQARSRGNWVDLPIEEKVFDNSSKSAGMVAGFKFGINFGKYTQFYLGYKAGYEGFSEISINAEKVEGVNLNLEIPRVAFVGLRLFGF
jgi:hypothetical protein